MNMWMVGGTRGSGIVSSAADVLGMRGMKGFGGVCEMCMALDGVGGEGYEWIRGLVFPVGTRGVLDVCLCLDCGGVGGIGGNWVGA